MKRPIHVWIVFAVCAAVLLGAVTWVTGVALRLQRSQEEVQRQAQFEEKVRLALWRMDSFLAPLIVQESSWPYFAYTSFYPAERAYNRMFNELQQGEVLVASPLLTRASTNILLHFQLAPNGQLTSPEVPMEPLPRSARVSAEMLAARRARLAEFNRFVTRESLFAASPGSAPTQSESGWVGQALMTANSQRPMQQVQAEQAAETQVLQNNVELQARAQNYRQVFGNYAQGKQASASAHAPAEEPMKPVWFGDALVLLRGVTVNGQRYIQGCWLDWAGLQSILLEGSKDLLPAARLEPISTAAPDGSARLLASLPVRLVPGSVPATSSVSSSPLTLALASAWACMLLAAGAVGVLLYSAVSLSERRGAFVSAVTHEMRTPLTTFKLYAEMLAAGIVSEPAKRSAYLNVLCSEANRLSHLVENVLAYARLERGSARRRVERLRLADLLDRVQPRLEEQAERSGMKLVVDADADALETVVHVDSAAVEQILFNLVDNACKYAADAAEKTIHLEALPESRFAMLRVRDHGRGISAGAARKLFKPFSKSAQEAAQDAPGIGLGLALCRRLSRSLGGDLRLAPIQGSGACFELRLPLSTRAEGAALSSI